MQRNFIVNLFFLLLLNFLIKPFWILGVDRGFQNAVGASDYGIYFALFNFTFLFYFFLDFGITNFNNKKIAQNNELVADYLPKLLTLKVVLGIIYFILTLGCAYLLNYDENQLRFLAILTFNQFLSSFIVYLRSNVSGLHYFKTDSLLSVLDRMLMISMCAALLLIPALKGYVTILTFAYTQTISLTITTIIAYAVVVKHTHGISIKWDSKFAVEILRKSFPYAILIMLMAFYNRIDSVLIERLLSNGKIQAGIYAQAFRLLDAVNMVAYLFSVLLLPMFAKQISQTEVVMNLAQFAFKITFALAIGVGLLASFHAHHIMELLYVDNVEESARVFSILMWCFLGTSTTYIFGTLLTANGSLRYLNFVALGGMALNLMLNYFLIPKLWATGSAIASVTTQIITAFMQMGIAYKLFNIRISRELIQPVVAYSVLSTLLFVALSYSTLFWVAQVAIATVIMIILLFICKMFSLTQIMEFSKTFSKTKNNSIND
ncbi:MAG: oligosaccharide flippase family protein [Bacteroidia bacterium]|nr:oligosaccharide flippase family protein [Bacteroidia bacterium]